ncbi:Gfo/Idh/MocA family protein [Nonomuraea sp. M3C6]|uniref:Gfo/Idh/MocA family protein n=1 Tax=Nonomuraea marmarensis TaxID=3351344 RepID=A0ABW7AKG8_9ACTN
MEPMKVAVLGAGNIAIQPNGVLPNLHHIPDKAVVTAIADPVEEKASWAAERFGIPKSFMSLEDMLDYGDFDAVVNLTPIPVHGETSLKILQAGKHLTTEKPVGVTIEEVDALEQAAAANGLTIVCAPPNMLYPTRREARRLLAANTIGQLCFVRHRSSGPGPGSIAWPSDPSWFYEKGSGPMFDIGVYSMHEMIGILNRPVKRVFGFFGITEAIRTVPAGPYRGLEIPVTANDNNLVLMDFGDSLFGVVDGTYNVWAAKSPRMEIFGREGVLNMWRNLNETTGQQLEVFRVDKERSVRGWWDVALGDLNFAQTHVDNLKRALIVEHLVDVVRGDRQNELPLDQARHALEIMLRAEEASQTGQAIELTTTFEPIRFDPSVKEEALVHG